MRLPAAVLLLVALVLPFAALDAATGPPDWKTPDKDWAKGPVRWIMTEDEAKEFKKLLAPEAREAFAKAFWEKRDPTPGTPENEYQGIFWERVTQADKVFKDVVREGSLTDPCARRRSSQPDVRSTVCVPSRPGPAC